MKGDTRINGTPTWRCWYMYMTLLFYKYSYPQKITLGNWFLVKKTKTAPWTPETAPFSWGGFHDKKTWTTYWSWLVNLTPPGHLPHLENKGLIAGRPYYGKPMGFHQPWSWGRLFLGVGYVAGVGRWKIVIIWSWHFHIYRLPVEHGMACWKILAKWWTNNQPTKITVSKKPWKWCGFNLTTIGNGLGILGASSFNSQVTWN